ncbi:MAG: hypothetical protein EBR82_26975 [Caulobacteraceae bacterium]|nr:hypothetical protein [Caulobacteraceae bacterium]
MTPCRTASRGPLATKRLLRTHLDATRRRVGWKDQTALIAQIDLTFELAGHHTPVRDALLLERRD